MPREFDRRIKISQEDKERMRAMYFQEHLYIRHIARVFESLCSRRMIQFILFPNRMKQNSENAKERGQSAKTYQRVRGKEWAGIMREHRAYKIKVLKRYIDINTTKKVA